jgi:RNA polymerase sigma-70 factor (ECF subfamily)
MAPPSDAVLWAEAVSGSRLAFGALFERHAQAIYAFCFRRTADWATAEDLTSAVFLEAWRRRHDIEPPEDSILPWLYGVATNLTRNARRGLRRHRDALASIPAWRDSPDFADEVAARLDAERSMRSVLARLDSLSRADRDVLALCVWAGLSYGEAAEVLGLPVGTVRSRLSRARSRLREPLGPNGQEPGVPDVDRLGAAPCGGGSGS